LIPKERVIRALCHEEPDRVPTGEIGIDYPITELTLGRRTFYRAKWREMVALWEGHRDEVVESYKRDIVALVRKFELDFVPVFLVPSKKAEVRKPRFIDRYTWEDEEGRIWRYSPQSGGSPICISEREAAMDDLKEPEPFEPDDSELELVRHVVKELGGTHFILGRGGDGSFPCTGGMASFLMRMITEPEFVKRATHIATERAIQINNLLLDEGCDAVLPGSDFASAQGPMMSPQHFREFIFPSIRHMVEAAHARGKFIIKHTDGNILPIMDMLIETGIDGWHGIQPSIGMDLKMLKESIYP